MSDETQEMREREAQAMHWTVRLRSGEARGSDFAAFERWLTECEANAAAYVYASQLWEATGLLKDLKSLEPLDVPGEPPLLPRTSREGWGRRWWATAFAGLRPRHVALASVLILVAAGAASVWRLTPTKQVYATEIGEIRHVTLGDGSQIDFGPDSAAEVRLTPTARSVVLTRGEALFSVAHDPTRPFSVAAEGGRVTALGTRFNVHSGLDGVTVSVLEGRVEVLTAPGAKGVPQNGATIALVTQNEQVSYANNGPIRQVVAGKAQDSTAWLRGLLVFNNDRLENVVAEASRFAHGRIVINDEGVRNMRVTAVFQTGDLGRLTAELEKVLPVSAVRGADDVIVLTRRVAADAAPIAAH